MVFVTNARSTYSTIKEQEGNTTQGHWHNIKLHSQMFSHVKKCTLYKYKTQGFPEIFDVLHHYFYMGLLT
jgi:hypothetical protein